MSPSCGSISTRFNHLVGGVASITTTPGLAYQPDRAFSFLAKEHQNGLSTTRGFIAVENIPYQAAAHDIVALEAMNIHSGKITQAFHRVL